MIKIYMTDDRFIYLCKWRGVQRILSTAVQNRNTNYECVIIIRVISETTHCHWLTALVCLFLF